MMTRANLLDVVYRFYPRGIFPYDRMHVPPGERWYDDMEEHRRLVEAAQRGRAEYPTWEAMIDRLGERYGIWNESLFLLAGGTAPAYSANVYLTKDITVGFHVSLLGPYYMIHGPGAALDEPAARDTVREIEVTYPGYQPLPQELGDEVAPDVAVDGASFGEATIGFCLFSDACEYCRRRTVHSPPAAAKPQRGLIIARGSRRR